MGQIGIKMTDARKFKKSKIFKMLRKKYGILTLVRKWYEKNTAS